MAGAVHHAGLSAFSDALLNASRAPWVPRMLPYQELPPWEDDWESFVMMAGRGSGKTTAAMYHLNRIASRQVIQGRIIAPTIGDAHECINGPVGLKRLNPAVKFRINERSVSWPNGSRVLIYGAFTQEDVERLRAGTNSELDIYEEMAAWIKLDEAVAQASLGLRKGDRPRSITSTTPRPRAALRKFIGRPGTVMRHATTDDNPYTPERYKRRVHAAFDGTKMGQQELQGILLPAIEGALWNPEMIEPWRVPHEPLMTNVVVGLDPAKTASNKSDETGIVVAGRGPGVPAGGVVPLEPWMSDLPDDAYILGDYSGHWTPNQWAAKAYEAAVKFGATTIVAEHNIAGDLVKANLEHYAEKNSVPNISIVGSRSRQAKKGRALPIVTLYEQHRVHHVGEPMVGLEGQQYEFLGNGTNDEDDDRVDALTLAVTELDIAFQVVVGRQARVV